jgi:hypothetical protein
VEVGRSDRNRPHAETPRNPHAPPRRRLAGDEVAQRLRGLARAPAARARLPACATTVTCGYEGCSRHSRQGCRFRRAVAKTSRWGWLPQPPPRGERSPRSVTKQPSDAPETAAKGRLFRRAPEGRRQGTLLDSRDG